VEGKSVTHTKEGTLREESIVLKRISLSWLNDRKVSIFGNFPRGRVSTDEELGGSATRTHEVEGKAMKFFVRIPFVLLRVREGEGWAGALYMIFHVTLMRLLLCCDNRSERV